MAGNAFPLIALAAGAAFMMTRKGGGTSAGPWKSPAPFLLLNTDCTMVDVSPEMETTLENYLRQRVPEISQKTKSVMDSYPASMDQAIAMGAAPIKVRLPATLSDAMKANLAEWSSETSTSNGILTTLSDSDADIYQALYTEFVPPSCYPVAKWHDVDKRFRGVTYPSVAASCLASLFQMGSAVGLGLGIDAEDVIITIGECVGLPLGHLFGQAPGS